MSRHLRHLAAIGESHGVSVVFRPTAFPQQSDENRNLYLQRITKEAEDFANNVVMPEAVQPVVERLARDVIFQRTSDERGFGVFDDTRLRQDVFVHASTINALHIKAYNDKIDREVKRGHMDDAMVRMGKIDARHAAISRTSLMNELFGLKNVPITVNHTLGNIGSVSTSTARAEREAVGHDLVLRTKDACAKLVAERQEMLDKKRKRNNAKNHAEQRDRAALSRRVAPPRRVAPKLRRRAELLREMTMKLVLKE